MSSQHSIGSMNQLADAFDESGITPDMVTRLRHPDFLAQMTLLLSGLATVVRASFKLSCSEALNVAEFVGNNWSVWKGPADGNGLDGKEYCVSDPDVVDFERIVLETHLKKSDNGRIHGEEKMRRARAGKNQLLGGRSFLALWKDWQKCKAEGKPEESVLEKLRRAKKIGDVICFFGLPLRNPIGIRCVLYLSFGGRGWYWDCNWLGDDWNADIPSASLASVK